MSPINREWFVVADDVIGGWAIATVDKPVSEIDTRDGTEFVLGDFISKEITEHIVRQHNRVWRRENR